MLLLTNLDLDKSVVRILGLLVQYQTSQAKLPVKTPIIMLEYLQGTSIFFSFPNNIVNQYYYIMHTRISQIVKNFSELGRPTCKQPQSPTHLPTYTLELRAASPSPLPSSSECYFSKSRQLWCKNYRYNSQNNCTSS